MVLLENKMKGVNHMKTLTAQETFQVGGGVTIASHKCINFATEMRNSLAQTIGDVYSETGDITKASQAAAQQGQSLLTKAPCNLEELNVAFKGLKLKHTFGID